MVHGKVAGFKNLGFSQVYQIITKKDRVLPISMHETTCRTRDLKPVFDVGFGNLNQVCTAVIETLKDPVNDITISTNMLSAQAMTLAQLRVFLATQYVSASK